MLVLGRVISKKFLKELEHTKKAISHLCVKEILGRFGGMSFEGPLEQ